MGCFLLLLPVLLLDGAPSMGALKRANKGKSRIAVETAASVGSDWPGLVLVFRWIGLEQALCQGVAKIRRTALRRAQSLARHGVLDLTS
ncbi:hypothetical protein RU08_25735 [Pseudomonas fulva]|uniref:Uncharacterized protein n=1 Tax=Pseudomonas fulva TaxID=47880 RepID=A0A0D0JMA9_9PSED|nr:hypothetical protein RU08_25735 [Pseudomonas fulva]